MILIELPGDVRLTVRSCPGGRQHGGTPAHPCCPARMIGPPSGVQVWLATGATDMRRGMNGLALQVQQALGRDPHAGDVYVFRGKRSRHGERWLNAIAIA